MLESEDKTNDKIQQILAFVEAKFINKSATKVFKDLTMLLLGELGK